MSRAKGKRVKKMRRDDIDALVLRMIEEMDR